MKILNKILSGYYGRKFSVAPSVLRIETTNLCNAKCITCPRNQMSRKLGVMDMELYKKILGEASSLKIKNLHLHNYGEPLLDPSLIEKIIYAKKMNFKVKIFSNASLITKEKAEELIASGIDEIKISMDGVTKNTFESIRKNLVYEDVINGINYLLEERKRKQSKTKISIVLVYLKENKDEAKLLKSEWKNKVDSIIITQFHNWGKENQYAAKGLKKLQKQIPCSRLWRTMTILWDGKVSLCCIDYNGEKILGDVSKETIKDIWNGEKYQHIRNLHIKGMQDKIKLCKVCSIGRL